MRTQERAGPGRRAVACSLLPYHRLTGRNRPLMSWSLSKASPPLPLRATIIPGMSDAPTDAPRVTRRLRSDAAANRERILAAATIAITRAGEKVPMATIADQAGVGIGTLYRHFPTRPALLAALTMRSFELVLQHARTAALSD
jgi:hypothetical protein